MAGYDVAVVGAGPAGSVAANRLARAGHRVALIERERVPRDKICGDGLIPDSLDVFEQLDVLERVAAAGHDVAALRFHAPNGSWFDVPQRMMCVRRERLDTILAEAAVESGATLIDGAEVTAFAAGDGGAELTLRRTTTDADGANGAGGLAGATLRVPLVILACGAAVEVMRRFGLPHRKAPSAVAARSYWRLRPDVEQDKLHIWYERSVAPGYAWAFPMGDHVFNVGVGAFHDTGAERPNLRDVFERLGTRVESAKAMLEGGEALGPMTGAPLRTRLEGCAFAADRLLVAGEAIGTTYSFTGEGIGKAMETGLMAADHAAAALQAGRFAAADLAAYERDVRARIGPRFTPYLHAQKWLRHPWVMNLVAARARKSERIRQTFTGMLAETEEPTAVFSVRGLLRLLFA